MNHELDKLKKQYISSKFSLPTELRHMLAQKQFENIRILGHRLYGSGATYGFRSISYLGKRIERAAKQEDTHQLDTLIEKLAQALKSYSSRSIAGTSI